MYTVIGMPKSRAARVIWMLEELREPYRIDPCLPHSQSATENNPSGKIPALIEADGHILVDSLAILTYLADKYQKFTHPAGTRERALQDSLTQFAADDLETPLWTAAKHSFILPEDKRVKAVKATCKWEFARSLEVLDQRLGERQFAVGDDFTIADLMLTNCILWSKMARFDPPPPRILAYAERIADRPAHRAAVDKGSF